MGVLSRKALEAELNQHLGYSEYDLKQIYQAINWSAAEQDFKIFKNKWIPIMLLSVRMWENNIEEVYQLFKFSKEIRKKLIRQTPLKATIDN